MVDSPVRLRLDPVLSGRGRLDGAWWPYSRDAVAELPGLIAAVDQRMGRTTLRVGLHADAWDHVPGRIPARGRRIEVGRLRGTDPRLITLMFAWTEAVNLLIIPPGITAGPTAASFVPAFEDTAGLSPADPFTTAHDPLDLTAAPEPDGPTTLTEHVEPQRRPRSNTTS